MNSKYFKPINEKIISASDFLKELEKCRENIKKSVFIPPKLGTQGFGQVVVTFRSLRSILDRHNHKDKIKD